MATGYFGPAQPFAVTLPQGNLVGQGAGAVCELVRTAARLGACVLALAVGGRRATVTKILAQSVLRVSGLTACKGSARRPTLVRRSIQSQCPFAPGLLPECAVPAKVLPERIDYGGLLLRSVFASHSHGSRVLRLSGPTSASTEQKSLQQRIRFVPGLLHAGSWSSWSSLISWQIACWGGVAIGRR